MSAADVNDPGALDVVTVDGIGDHRVNGIAACAQALSRPGLEADARRGARHIHAGTGTGLMAVSARRQALELRRRIAQPRSARARLGRKFTTPPGVGHKVAERRRERRWLRGRNEDAARRVDNLLRRALPGRQDGQAGGQRLDEGDAERLGLEVRLAIEIRCREKPSDIRALAKPADSVANPFAGRLGAESFQERALVRSLSAADLPPDPAGHAAESGERIEQLFVSLPLLAATCLRDDHAVRRRLEGRANVQANGVGDRLRQFDRGVQHERRDAVVQPVERSTRE